MTKEELPTKNSENSELRESLWCSAPYLFERLKALTNTDLVAEEIISEHQIIDPLMQKYIEKNIESFYMRIFADQSIGISKVTARLSKDVLEDRQRVTELFRRLNFEGMKLSTLDLVASLLKNFDYRMENFIDEVCSENSEIGVDQDVLVKLLLILNDKPGKRITELNADDAKFATESRKRIEATLDALKKFLKASDNEAWYKSRKGVIKRSAIPLYFLAYHIFYSKYDTTELPDMFSKFDVKDKNFRAMSIWLKLSLLNQVFKKGCGWIPDKTGIKMIHAVMKNKKGMDFPVQELFDVYRSKLHKFFDEKSINTMNLDDLDQEYVFYIMYNGTTRSSIRSEDKDHIQPRSLLMQQNVKLEKINSIGNFQLIDSSSNRGLKNDEPLSEWLEKIDNQTAYIERHLIPEEPRLWVIENFHEFLRERQKKIVAKIKASL